MNTQYMHKLSDMANKELSSIGSNIRYTRVVSNDMASNYYAMLDGEEHYVDQFELQEYFSVDDGDTDYYASATDEERTMALVEMALALFNKL